MDRSCTILHDYEATACCERILPLLKENVWKVLEEGKECSFSCGLNIVAGLWLPETTRQVETLYRRHSLLVEIVELNTVDTITVS